MANSLLGNSEWIGQCPMKNHRGAGCCSGEQTMCYDEQPKQPREAIVIAAELVRGGRVLENEAARRLKLQHDEIELLRENVRLLHDATIVLRNGVGGHNHWDPTQRRGAGCVICQMQREARQRADDLITQCGLSEQ